MSDKRQHERIALRAHLKLVHPVIGEHEVEMRDMSNGGVFLLATNKHEFPIGTVVQVQALNIEDAPVISAMVVRHDTNGIGLKFIEQ